MDGRQNRLRDVVGASVNLPQPLALDGDQLQPRTQEPFRALSV